MLEIEKKIHNVWILFRLKGSLNATSAPELDKVVLPEIDNRLDLIFDMKDLTYISSMGLRSLMLYVKKTYDVFHHVALCNVQENVKEVIETAGVHSLLEIYDDIKDVPFAQDVEK